MAAGHGRNAPLLRRHAERVVGVENDPEAIEALVRCYSLVSMHDITEPFNFVPDGFFQLVVHWRQAHHKTPEVFAKMAREVARLLAPGEGTYALAVRGERGNATEARLSAGKFGRTDFYYSPNALVNLLARIDGLDGITTEYVEEDEYYDGQRQTNLYVSAVAHRTTKTVMS
jgi:SAM-dependent methyltransferase